MGDGLGLDAWWDEPAYRAAEGTFTERGAFISATQVGSPATKLKDVLVDLLERQREED